MPKPNDKRINIRIPSELEDEAQGWAYHLNMTFSQFVRDAIEEKIEKHQ
jgi:predicted DNA-binding protein